MKGLTERQQMAFDFIRDMIARKGRPPTLREIGKHMGIRSTNGVNDHLRALERKGFIARDQMLSRSTSIIGDHPKPPPCCHTCGRLF